MKGRVDTSMGIETRIAEALAKIKPTKPLRLAKLAAWRKRNWSDSSGNSPAKALAQRCALMTRDLTILHPNTARRPSRRHSVIVGECNLRLLMKVVKVSIFTSLSLGTPFHRSSNRLSKSRLLKQSTKSSRAVNSVLKGRRQADFYCT